MFALNFPQNFPKIPKSLHFSPTASLLHFPYTQCFQFFETILHWHVVCIRSGKMENENTTVSGVIDPAQILALRENGFNDEQICSALSICPEDLVKSAVMAAVKDEGQLGHLMEFTPGQIQAARNMIATLAITGESEHTRLKACNLILNLTSVSAETKYRNAKGLDKGSTVNNIMIAVQAAQEKKNRLFNGQ